MKAFVPLIESTLIPTLLPAVPLTLASMMAERQNRASDTPTFDSLLEARMNMRQTPQVRRDQPSQQTAGAPIVLDSQEPIVSGQRRAPLDAITEDNEQQSEVPRENLDQVYETDPLLPQDAIDEIQAQPDLDEEEKKEVISMVADQYRANLAAQRQQQEAIVREVAEEVAPDQPGFLKWLAQRALPLVTAETAVDVVVKLYDVYKSNYILNHMKDHDQLTTFAGDQPTQDEMQKLLKTPTAPQCKRHVWVDKDGNLRSLLTCSDRYGTRHYENQ